MRKQPKFTLNFLRSILDYNPETGVFVWKINRPPKGFAGEVAGRLSHGYRQIGISQHIYMAHRLAWFYVYGTWPQGDLDHINGVTLDNRIANLRLATTVENGRNRGPQINNTSGFKGVTYNKNRRCWLVQLRAMPRRSRTVAAFHDVTDAARCYNYHAAYSFGEFAKLNDIQSADYAHD